ncbi:alternate-type signal peptide domain-containing protein [Cryobacterium sp. Y57]|uniref:alternate-type signal peptide domain-containing protein n=1 Tax=Cryobacterium sp. Y57 TaxID=2048287 RepID=UPI001E55A023|nr:alternate-type signal peptide domain-containing protein [Cryobacterium sp. Y57]
MLKGSIAGAAGVALLLGGAGTFALWNDDAAIAGAIITAGTLTVKASESTWRDGAGTEITEPEKYLIVPGDTLTSATTLTVNAQGDNLQATLNIPQGSIAAHATTDKEDVALYEALEVMTTVTTVEDGGTVAIEAEVDGSYKVNVSAGESQEYLVTVAVDFPSGAEGDDNAAQAGRVDLSAFDVTLTQTPAPAPVAE